MQSAQIFTQSSRAESHSTSVITDVSPDTPTSADLVRTVKFITLKRGHLNEQCYFSWYLLVDILGM